MKLSEILDIIYSNFHFRMDSNLLSDRDKYNEKRIKAILHLAFTSP